MMNSTGKKNSSDLRCINCGWEIDRLFVQYSPGNIRLMKCEKCKAVADPYIECEFMILLIDLILHKTKAYRHLLYNRLTLEKIDIKGVFWKTSLINPLLDTYRILVFNGKQIDWGFSGGILLAIWACAKVLVEVILWNGIFVSVLLLGTRTFLNSNLSSQRYRDLILAILISSYFKLFLLTTMVWEFPSSGLFIVDLFVLSSNCAALRVLSQLKLADCIGVCLIAQLARFFALSVSTLIFSS